MVRSEKETEELLNMKSEAIIDSLKDLNVAEKYRLIASLFYSLKDTIKSTGGTIYERGLEGEPRYSVAELEKIVKIKTEDDTEFREWNGVFRFFEFLKDKKRVEAILK